MDKHIYQQSNCIPLYNRFRYFNVEYDIHPKNILSDGNAQPGTGSLHPTHHVHLESLSQAKSDHVKEQWYN